MTYDITPVKAPRATGSMLKLLCRLAENPVTGPLLSRPLLTSVGVADMRVANAAEPQWTWARLMNDTRPGAAPPALNSPEALPPEGFPFATAADYATAYRQERTTPEDVADRFLAASSAADEATPALRAFIAIYRDDLMKQAAESAARHRDKRPLGPLDGVPVAIKDELDQAPYPTTVGTKFLGKTPAMLDATVVARLRTQGALLVGKTNMHEFGMGVTGLNPHHGSARNPYDPKHATGGSSSGSAAAVGSGLCPVAIGADGGGSVRIPSSFCGVVGLKPTFGRVSEHGAAPVCWSLAHIGPIGASAGDVAAAYLAIAGPDASDQNSLGHPDVAGLQLGNGRLDGMRLGIFTPWFDDADPQVAAACHKVVETLTAAGALVTEISIPELSLVRSVHLVTIVSEMATAHQEYYRAHRKDYGFDVRMNLALARRLTGRDYVHAQRLRTRICSYFYDALEDVDAIVTPTTGCTAPPLPDDALATGDSNLTLATRIMLYAQAGNLTGLPAISFPAGYDDAGLPIGFQAMGRPWREDLLLKLAAVAEQSVVRKKPNVFFELL